MNFRYRYWRLAYRFWCWAVEFDRRHNYQLSYLAASESKFHAERRMQEARDDDLKRSQ